MVECPLDEINRPRASIEPQLRILHLALVFHLSHTTAARYANIAEKIMDEEPAGELPSTPRDDLS